MKKQTHWSCSLCTAWFNFGYLCDPLPSSCNSADGNKNCSLWNSAGNMNWWWWVTCRAPLKIQEPLSFCMKFKTYKSLWSLQLAWTRISKQALVLKRTRSASAAKRGASFILNKHGFLAWQSKVWFESSIQQLQPPVVWQSLMSWQKHNLQYSFSENCIQDDWLLELTFRFSES